MEKIKYFWNHILAPACAFFTVIVFIVSAVGAGLKSGGALSHRALTGFFLFSLAAAALNLVLTAKHISTALKVIIHYVGMVGCFFVSFFLVAYGISNAVGGMYVLIILSVIYFILIGIFFAIRAAINRSREEKTVYKNQFKGR